MFDKSLKIVTLIVSLCVGGYYVTGVILNWRQLKQQNKLKKSKNYE